MAPKTHASKGKGKVGVGSSRQHEIPHAEVPVNALSILHPAVAGEFERSFQSRIVMKPHTFNKREAESLHLTEVCSLLDAQEFGDFLVMNDSYHEDFIRAFYAGMRTSKNCLFQCKLETRTYSFIANDWTTVFGILLSVFSNSSWHDQSYNMEYNEEEYLTSIWKLEREPTEDEHITT